MFQRIDGHGDELWADTPQTGICRLFEVGVPRGKINIFNQYILQ